MSRFLMVHSLLLLCICMPQTSAWRSTSELDIIDKLEVDLSDNKCVSHWRDNGPNGTLPSSGQTIGNYQLMSCLGIGGTSAVWGVKCVGRSCASQTKALAMKIPFEASDEAVVQYHKECEFGKAASKRDPIHIRSCVEVGTLRLKEGKRLLFSVWVKVVGESAEDMKLRHIHDGPPSAFGRLSDVAMLVVDMFETIDKITTPDANTMTYYSTDFNLGNVFITGSNELMLIDYGNQATCDSSSSDISENNCEYLVSSHSTPKPRKEIWARWKAVYDLFRVLLNLMCRHDDFANECGNLAKLTQARTTFFMGKGPKRAADFFHPGTNDSEPEKSTPAESDRLRAEIAEEFIQNSMWHSYHEEIATHSSSWLNKVVESGLETISVTVLNSAPPWPPEFVSLLKASLSDSGDAV